MPQLPPETPQVQTRKAQTRKDETRQPDPSVEATAAEKATLRKDAAALRATAHAACPDAGRRAMAHVLEAIGPDLPRVVSGYMPIRSEIDPGPVLAALHEQGVILALPVIEEMHAPLAFRSWVPGGALVPGRFGAAIPGQGPGVGAPVTPDLLIVPLLAFDPGLQRLGYGGGFYDRTLARLRAAGPVRAIGLAFEAQGALRFPTEETDQPLDAIATECGLHWPLR